jgi:hypothetical protein
MQECIWCGRATKKRGRQFCSTSCERAFGAIAIAYPLVKIGLGDLDADAMCRRVAGALKAEGWQPR